VIIVLYIISAILAAIAGFVLSGLTNVASVTLADSYVLPSVAAAVLGGTSIMGGRGGYGGTIVGALILTVVSALLSSLGYPEAVRQILFGAIIVVVAAAYTRVTSET
jgi:ribose transport system permease protein